MKLRVAIGEFANEIKGDLPELIKTYPNGIYVNHLHDHYGESAARIQRAWTILADRHLVVIHRSASNALYILPTNYTPNEVHIDLTELQRKLVKGLVDIALKHNTTLVQTSYSQLARINKCSYGGIHSSINRLVHLDLLAIEAPSKPGQQNSLILRLSNTLLKSS